MSGAFPLPAARSWGWVARTRCPCVPVTGGVGMGDPAPTPQRALLRAGFAGFRGWREGVPGGRALRRCEGRLRSGTRPPPAVHPRGGLLGSAAHVL